MDDDDKNQQAQRLIEEMTRITWLKSRNFDSDDVNKPRARFPCDTAVHVAVFEANLDMLEYLHKRGASMQATNALGFTPLQNASGSVTPAIIAWVSERSFADPL